jgi:RHS repeat-associated protein
VSAVNGTITSTFTYEPNGNQTGGLNRSISYYSFNMPSAITQGSSSNTLFFQYDTEHARYWKAAPEGGTLYFDAFGVHAELFLGTNWAWYDYLSAGGAMVGVWVQNATSTTPLYFHADNLGSIAVITDTNGAVVTRNGYDAWGKRRWATGADGDPPTSQMTRGFTGQEELFDGGLVHLNGRIYDPLLARMMSADPMVPDPMNGQAWNRYSYVVNNPLAFTDPSGYCFLGLCGIGNFFNNFFKDIQHLLRDVPIIGTIVEVAAAALCLGVLVCAVTAAFISTTAVAGIETGNFRLGLRAGLIAAATAVAFWEVGNLTNAIAGADPYGPHIQPQIGTSEYAFNVTAHAAVGCASAVASGGKCGPSALAGGVTSAAGPVVNGHGFFFGLVANTTLGGGAAVLGGGKFENGAITGAFGYLFNACGSDPNGCLKRGFAAGATFALYSGSAATAGTGGVALPAALVIGGLDILVGGTLGAIGDIIGNGLSAWTGSIYNSDNPGRKGDNQNPPCNDCEKPNGGTMKVPDLPIYVCPDCAKKNWDYNPKSADDRARWLD